MCLSCFVTVMTNTVNGERLRGIYFNLNGFYSTEKLIAWVVTDLIYTLYSFCKSFQSSLWSVFVSDQQLQQEKQEKKLALKPPTAINGHTLIVLTEIGFFRDGAILASWRYIILAKTVYKYALSANARTTSTCVKRKKQGRISTLNV